jgi:uncharacterized protein (DUF433 family)
MCVRVTLNRGLAQSGKGASFLASAAAIAAITAGGEFQLPGVRGGRGRLRKAPARFLVSLPQKPFARPGFLHILPDMTPSTLLSRITFNPAQCGGHACIRGMRIRVKDVLDMLAGGADAAEILADFPYLEPDDIRACLEHAATVVDHRVLVTV